MRSEGDAVQGASVRTLRFSTREFEPHQQFDAWQEIANPVLDVRSMNDNPRNGYAAEMTARHLGQFVLATETFDPMAYEIGAAAIRRANVDHWVISLNRGGRTVMEVGGAVLSTPVGGISVRSLATPLRGEASADRMLFLYVPRDLFADHAAAFDAAIYRGLRPTFARLLSDFVISLERQLGSEEPVDLSDICDATTAMLKCCIVPNGDAVVEAGAALTTTLLEKARRHIKDNIHSPSLGTAELCQVLRVSRSQLYRLFEHRGVAGEIRRQRLVASHRMLSDPSSRQPVYAIAEALCFSSPEEFAKSFRREFGYSPSDARDKRPPMVAFVTQGEGNGQFHEWLLHLPQ